MDLIKRKEAGLPLSFKEKRKLAKLEKEATEYTTEKAVTVKAVTTAKLAVDAEEKALIAMDSFIDMINNKSQEDISVAERSLVAEYASKINTILKSRRKGKQELEFNAGHQMLSGAPFQIVINTGEDKKPEINTVVEGDSNEA